MRKNINISNTQYIGLSVGIAMMLLLTSLPYKYLMAEQISIGEFRLEQDELMIAFLFIFPLLAFGGSVTTLRKKKQLEDIFINAGMPLLLTILFVSFDHYKKLCTIILVLLLIAAVFSGGAVFATKKNFPFAKKVRYMYYIVRKNLFVLLMITVTPLGIYTYYRTHFGFDEMDFLYKGCARVVEEQESIDDEIKLVDAATWDIYSGKQRLDLMTDLADYYCTVLGIPQIPIYAGDSKDEGLLGVYMGKSEVVFLEIDYLENCSIEEACHTTIHEIYHHYEKYLIKTLAVLERSGVPYKNMPYYQEIIELAYADAQYVYLNSQENYLNNKLESEANAFAEREVEYLKEIYGW